MAEAQADSMHVSNDAVFTHRDFNRGLKGTANLESFLERLPSLHQEAGSPFLEGEYIALHNSKKLLWSHIPKKPDEYGTSVLTVPF